MTGLNINLVHSIFFLHKNHILNLPFKLKTKIFKLNMYFNFCLLLKSSYCNPDKAKTGLLILSKFCKFFFSF